MMQDEQPADEKLLQAYLMRRDEAAFGRLVQRHLGLVFGTAFRLLGERTSAEEVAQNVFITLARKAASIRPDGGLAGWLHRAAVLEAQLRQRTDLRRRNREDLAARLAATMPPQDPADSLLLDTLDQALLELPEKDRRVLLLRYLESRSLREVGNAMGIGEDAAQKRTRRATEALAGILHRHGFTTTTAAMVARTLEAAVVLSAPVPSASAITATALASASSVAAVAMLAGKFMALSKTQTATLCIILAAAPVGYQWQLADRTRDELLSARIQASNSAVALTEAQVQAASAQRRANASLAALASARSELRIAVDQLKNVQTTTDASLYLWSESSPFVRIPKAIASHLDLGSVIRIPGADDQSIERRLDAVSADGELSEALEESLGIIPTEARSIRDAFSYLSQTLRQKAASHAYLTNQPPAEFRTYGGMAFTLVTPALSSGADAIQEAFRARLDGILGQERSAVLWQQAQPVFAQEFNSFGATERIQTVVIHAPDNMAFWDTHREADGTLGNRGWSNSAGILNLDILPEQLRPLVADWIARHPASTPSPSPTSTLMPRP
jgi:RNA polymerase sigma factor (sigma-70 family)